jgi:hypothetical protein
MSGPTGPVQDYPTREPRRNRPSPWLAVALAIAVVIIVVLSVVVITQANDDSDNLTPAAPTQSSSIQPSQPGVAQPAPTNASPSMTCEGYNAAVDENAQPGWHAAINRLGLAYAVPPDWSVAACGVRMGWAKPCPEGNCVIRDLGAVATVANPTCPNQNIAMAGVTQSKNPDIRAALNEETRTVPLIYTQDGKVPTIELAPVREFTIGTQRAIQTVATVRDIATDKCTGPSAFHSMVVTTIPNVEGSVVFLISLREGTNVSPKPDVINEIVRTLRSPA